MTAGVVPGRPGELLGRPAADRHRLGRHLWGFGGVHGGLTLALMTAAMSPHAPGTGLRSATARFHRTLTEPFAITVSAVRATRMISTFAAVAASDKGTYVEATGTFGTPLPETWPVIAPEAPLAPPPDACAVFTVPPEFVPISTSLQIRPVGPHRPYAGGRQPELTAWVRLLEDDLPPDQHRFVLLMDALAPSYAAVLTELAMIPTIEMTVRPSEKLSTASSPWVLLRARTLSASSQGWIDEEIQAWGEDGLHLGSAHQLRLIRTS